MQWRGGAGSRLARHGLSPCTQQCRAHFPRFSVSPLVTGPQKVRYRPHAGQGEPREENPRCADVGVHSAGLDLLPGRGRYLRRQFARRARVMPPPSGGAPGRQCVGCTALDGVQCTKSDWQSFRSGRGRPRGCGAVWRAPVPPELPCWVIADDWLFACVPLRVPEQPTRIRVPRVHPSTLLLGHSEGGGAAEVLSAPWERVIPELSNSVFPHAVNKSKGLTPVVLSQHWPARNKCISGPRPFCI